MGRMKRSGATPRVMQQVDGPGSDEPVYRATLDLDPDRFCCACGTLLLGLDPEDTLDAEGPGRDLCGNCYRAREGEAIEQFEGGI
jgi:hypothetical protein